MKPQQQNQSSVRKYSAVGALLAVLLIGIVFILFGLDLGKGPIFAFSQQYINGSSDSQTIPLETVTSPPVNTKSEVLYRSECPQEQVMLTTDATTLNGASVSCWPNTVSDDDTAYSVDTRPPLKSVFCAAGTSKSHTSSNGRPQVKVSCV